MTQTGSIEKEKSSSYWEKDSNAAQNQENKEGKKEASCLHETDRKEYGIQNPCSCSPLSANALETPWLCVYQEFSCLKELITCALCWTAGLITLLTESRLVGSVALTLLRNYSGMDVRSLKFF